jgi:hypothetical protein
MLIQEGGKDKGKIRGKGYGLRGKGKKRASGGMGKKCGTCEFTLFPACQLASFQVFQFIYEWMLEKEIYDKLTEGVINVL